MPSSVAPVWRAVLFAGALSLPVAAAAQPGARPLRVLGGVAGQQMEGIRAAAFRGDELVVLDAPGSAPRLHFFSPRGHRIAATSRSEMRNPRSVAWINDVVLVRDPETRRILGFDGAGRLVSSRPLPAGQSIALSAAGGDTLLGLSTTAAGIVMRLRGARQDTLLRLPVTSRIIRLTAPGVPSLELPAPFEPHALWTGLPSGGIAVWEGRGAVRVLNRAGEEVATLALPTERHPVTEADRDRWLAGALPVIRGEAVFEPLRERARATVEFPSTHPAALALIADPEDGVWVLRTPAASGQRWLHLTRRGAAARLDLPPGQSLLAVGRSEVAVFTRSRAGERIHVYAKPRTMAQRAPVRSRTTHPPARAPRE